MYAQLDDIVFELLKGFESFGDTVESLYVEHPRPVGKPTLEGKGEKLQEISFTIRWRQDFCTPLVEYQRLNAKRKERKVMILTWGDGNVEGSFVLTSLERTIEELNPNGSFRAITCNVKLLEYFQLDAAQDQKASLEAAGFANESNVTAPQTVIVSEPSPATDVMDDVQDVTLKSDQVNSKLDTAVVQANGKTATIDKAQEFVNQVNSESYQLKKLIRQLKELLTAIGSKLAANPALATIAPLLTAQISASQTAMNDAETLVNDYSNLPNPVNSLSDANTILAAMNDTVQVKSNLSTETKNLKKASLPVMMAVATRKEV